MSRRPVHPKQFEAVIALPARERSEYAFKRFADWEQLYALYSEGWAVMALDEDEIVTFPVWPEPEFAAAYAVADWTGYEVRVIDLYEFLEAFLPDFETKGMLVNVFPVESVGGIPVTPDQFRDFLQQELDRY